jgi:hypothetical protein
MYYAVEVRRGGVGKESGHIIHRTSCIVFSGEIYPLGEFTSYDLALSRSKQLGFINLNGCYWCCHWNLMHSAETEQGSTG